MTNTPSANGNHRKLLPGSTEETGTASPAVKSGKIAKRVRAAMAKTTTSQTASAKSARRTRIRSNGHVASIEIPGIPAIPSGQALPLPPSTRRDVIVSLPRRQQSRAVSSREWSPPRMKLSATPKVGLPLLVARLAVWINVFAGFAFGSVWDVIRRRDSQERRAVRLRRAIERAGGTLVRIGRQMAVRLDILPVRYCEQLATMYDRMPPFPTEDAIAIIERVSGQRLSAIFSTFDPQPIDSSSVYCIYQAVLRRTGEKVVVKVRRPGIHVVFEADYRVLVFLVRLAAALTVIRPGYADGFYKELRKTLTDELDFRRGARYEELFERRVRKSKKSFVSAPKIYGELLSEEVLVQEFVSGMWLWEILAALERHDEAGLAYMRQLNIEPRKLARRLLFAHNWAVYEHLTFYADPHPANIIVRANSKLVFLNFGTNGYVTKPRRELFSRFYACQAKQDIWGMAQATIALLEPLAARDLNTMAKEIEAAYYVRILAVKSKHSRWHERTSVAMWLAAFRVMRRYKIPAPMDVLVYVRATLFCDTLAARLNPRIDYFKEFQRYTADYQERRRKRGMKMFRRRLRNGLLTDQDFATVEKAASTASDLFFRLQRLLAVPYDFAVITLTVEKWVVTLFAVIGFLVRAALATGLGVALVLGVAAVNGQAITLGDSLRQVLDSGAYHVIVAVLLLIHIRLILFRLADKTRKDK